LNKQQSEIEVVEPWTVHIDSQNCGDANPNECGDLRSVEYDGTANQWL
jgi:hypothetical protein